ncbi:MAG: hypothetical protein JW740_00820 [Candidatus Zambryskibacteria bacterium]|nr:hypothetical protein [Candidatus Zambryskibacteria bacterium]
MKKIILIVLLVVLGTLIITLPKTKESANSPDNNKSLPIIGDIDLPSLDLPFSEKSVKDEVWEVFENYLTFNKNRDLKGVESVVYKISPVCADSATRVDCDIRMGLAHQYGMALNKKDFTNVWSDDNQVILATNYWTEISEELDQYGRFRSIIFFIKIDDYWKLLSFSPTQGGAVTKGAASQEEINDRLIKYTEDNDEDGKLDYEEECLNILDRTNCVKTSPVARDTNGNGLWDSVEALMDQMQ